MCKRSSFRLFKVLLLLLSLATVTDVLINTHQLSTYAQPSSQITRQSIVQLEQLPQCLCYDRVRSICIRDRINLALQSHARWAQARPGQAWHDMLCVYVTPKTWKNPRQHHVEHVDTTTTQIKHSDRRFILCVRVATCTHAQRANIYHSACAFAEFECQSSIPLWSCNSCSVVGV